MFFLSKISSNYSNKKITININIQTFRMEFPRQLGRSISLTSSEESGSTINPYAGYICQDPKIKINMPNYIEMPDNSLEIKLTDSESIRASNSLRRGLYMLRVLSNVSDPELTEWTHSLKIIIESLDIIRAKTTQTISSTTRWKNILQYISRSRRFITWIKIMKSLSYINLINLAKKLIRIIFEN